ncbi:MAG: elongation factor P 5-aminopentanone reductase [Bacillota bacterium]
MSMQGQAALVSGASRGIGRAIALALAAEGAAVAVNYLQDRAGADETCRLARAAGADALAVQADISEPPAAEGAVARCLDRFGRLDVLVNNAGTALSALLVDTGVDEWDRLMAVHLRGSFNLSRAALRPMMDARRGRIINISSIWGIVGAAGEVAYSTAKAGVIGFTRALAKEVGPWNITVNAVAPGAIETDMLSDLTAEDRRELAERTPLGRLGTPEEVAAAVLFLAGPGGAFLTGQVISPNGGLVI